MATIDTSTDSCNLNPDFEIHPRADIPKHKPPLAVDPLP